MNKLANTVSAPPRPRFRLAACRRCGGDGLLDPSDGGEWRCLQCARPLADQPSIYQHPDAAPPNSGQTQRAFAA